MGKEIFKDIKGYEGLYQVSDLGNVKSLNFHKQKKEKVLKNTTTDGKGYHLVNLHKKGKGSTSRVHRLVAIAFLPNPLNKPEVNHKDGNKSNNRVENLEWNTKEENEQHAWKNGLKNASHLSGEKQHVSKLKEYEILQIRDLYKSGRFILKEIGELYNCDKSNIGLIVNRKAWAHVQ